MIPPAPNVGGSFFLAESVGRGALTLKIAAALFPGSPEVVAGLSRLAVPMSEAQLSNAGYRNHAANGRGVWRSTAAPDTEGHQIGGSDTTYSVVGVGDYFGSNGSDILFRNSAGDTWVEQITNGAFAGWSHIGGSNTAYTVPITVGPPALT
jgi:hypothetical protein